MDGEVVEWELDLENYVRTRGYGRVAATLDTFEVRVMHNREVIGSVYSGYTPRGGAADAAPARKRENDLMKKTGGIGRAEAEGNFHNLFFESRVETNLVSGNVSLPTSAGSVTPTLGKAFAFIQGSNNVAGFVTTINLPLDAQTLTFDSRFLTVSTNPSLTNALLAVAVWDTNGMAAGVEVHSEPMTL